MVDNLEDIAASDPYRSIRGSKPYRWFMMGLAATALALGACGTGGTQGPAPPSGPNPVSEYAESVGVDPVLVRELGFDGDRSALDTWWVDFLSELDDRTTGRIVSTYHDYFVLDDGLFRSDEKNRLDWYFNGQRSPDGSLKHDGLFSYVDRGQLVVPAADWVPKVGSVFEYDFFPVDAPAYYQWTELKDPQPEARTMSFIDWDPGVGYDNVEGWLDKLGAVGELNIGADACSGAVDADQLSSFSFRVNDYYIDENLDGRTVLTNPFPKAATVRYMSVIDSGGVPNLTVGLFVDGFSPSYGHTAANSFSAHADDQELLVSEGDVVEPGAPYAVLERDFPFGEQLDFNVITPEGGTGRLRGGTGEFSDWGYVDLYYPFPDDPVRRIAGTSDPVDTAFEVVDVDGQPVRVNYSAFSAICIVDDEIIWEPEF